MNLALWDNLKTPPKEALKTITGGRLNGKTDINPMWRIKAMTEQFGQCGVGWKVEIVNTWMVEGDGGQKMLYMQVHLFTKENDTWSAPIPGFGGDFIISKEKGGLHCNDEAFKMALTDAFGNAMKSLGMAADVYLGASKETKYDKQHEDNKPPEKPNTDNTFLKRLIDLSKAAGLDSNAMKAHIQDTFKVSSSKDLTEVQTKQLIEWLEKQIGEKGEGAE